MDLLGSIINNMEKVPSVSTEKTKQVLGGQKQTNAVPNFKQKLQQLSYSIYKCGICGKTYTEKKKRDNHRNSHKKHKKKKLMEALNLAGEKDKNIVNVTNESLAIELGPYNDTLTLPVDNNNKLDNNKQSAIQKKVPEDQLSSRSNFNQRKLLPLKKKPSYKCNLCSRIFTKRKMLENHKENHKYKTEKEALNSVGKEESKLTNLIDEPSLIKLGGNIDTPILPVDDTNQNSVQQMEVSVSQPSSPLDCQKKLVLPEKESSYNCDICGRIFTKKKTYENHKTNHTKNRNTAKHLFFERGKGKIKST